MRWTKTPFFHATCRLLAFLMVLDAVRQGGVALPFRLSIRFGPTAAYAQDDLLASTPEADAEDPYVVAKAAELGGDPAQIFAFVRDEIAFESYTGSLRGARGTLWSRAGNALDQASLTIALLRAAGVPSRYARGPLPDGLARELVLSMFPEPLRVVGCLPPGTETADPASDPRLLAEAVDHFWLQLDTGGGFQDADPSFAGAQIGETFATTQDTFAEVPDGLRHKVTVRVKRELTTPLTSLFGAPAQDVATVLDETFITGALAGKPLSVGHFVNQSVLGGIFSATTNTYAPYVLVGDVGRDAGLEVSFRGQDYQEMLTSFPFGSQILTGVFLEVALSGPDGPTETHERALLDRIGFDVRQNGGSPSLTLDTSGAPALLDFDVVTVNALAGLQDPQAIEQLNAELAEVAQRVGEFPTDGSRAAEATTALREAFTRLERVQGVAFSMASDSETGDLARSSLVKAYFDRPRLTLTSLRTKIEGAPQNPSLSLVSEMDLRRDRIRVLAFPGQSEAAVRAFNATRGIVENVLERDVFNLFLIEGETPPVTRNTASIFTSALAQGVGLATITGATLAKLDALDVSAEAKARIAQAVAQPGQIVLVPAQSVVIDGSPATGWYQIDTSTGEVIGVTENGGHNQLAQNAFAYLLMIGIIIAVLATALAFLIPKIQEAFEYFANCIKCFSDQITTFNASSEACMKAPNCKAYQPPPGSMAVRTAAVAEPSPPPFFTGQALLEDERLGAALESVLAAPLLTDEPELAPLLRTAAPLDYGDLAGSGVAGDIVADPQFSLPLDGALLPTLFRVAVKNLGAATDRFALDLSSVPPGFTAQTSVAEITVPPGETAEVGICLRPTGGLPAPGSNASFDLAITSTTNGAITTTESAAFVIPEVHGLSLASAPPSVSTTPGTPGAASLIVRATGNVAEDVSFATSLPANLSLSGLTSVSLAAGDEATLPLVLTPAAGTALNSTLTATIDATFGAPRPRSLVIPVRVVVPGADAVAGAAVAAGQLGNAPLAEQLDGLSIALTNLVQDPGSAVFKSQALALLDSLIELLGDDPALSDLVADLAAARDALAAAATPGDVLAGVTALGNALDGLATRLTGLSRHRFDISLSPNTAVAMPQTASQLGLVLRNTGGESSTYTFAVENLPGGVTASFVPSSITLAPGEVVPRVGFPGVTLSLTPTGADQLQPLDFVVRATVQQSPDVQRTASGSLSVRDEVVSVVEVTATPAFTDAGGQVQVAARVLNSVNQQRSALISYVVKDPDGNVVATSSPQPVELALTSSLQTLALPDLDTTGFADGGYAIEVALVETGGAPIPGATGAGTLLIGSPVTAFMTLAPEILPPGDGQVVSRLQIDTDVSFPEPFTLLGLVDTSDAGGIANTVALFGTYAYVCTTEGIAIVDVSDASAPEVVGTFSDGLINGVAATSCTVVGDRLYAASTFSGGSQLVTWSLADPLDPQQVGFAPFPYNFVSDILVRDDHALFSTNGVFFFLGGVNTIFRQFGDFLSVEITGLQGVGDVVFDTTGPTLGGLSNLWQLARVTDDIVYVAGSTSQAGDTQTGSGRILVVDVSDPAELTVLEDLPIPGTVHATGIAVDGNRALVAGSTGGWRNPFTPGFADLEFLGTTTLTSLDISDPAHPLVVGETLTTSFGPIATSGNLYAAGAGVYAMNGIAVGGEQSVALVDANDPENLIVSTAPIPAGPPGGLLKPRGFAIAGDRFYALTSLGLGVFEFSNVVGIPVTASVRVPKGTGVATVPGSFSSAPTEVVTGPDFDTLVWKRAFAAGQTSEVITFASAVSDLAAGEARDVTEGATIDFVAAGTPGQIELPPLTVAADHILSLAPATQTVAPGAEAAYALSVDNPSTQSVVYDLAVQGVPAGWVTLDANVTVGPQQTVEIPLLLRADPLSPLGAYGFTVTASGDDGAQGSVVGELVLVGAPVFGEARARGVVVDLTPSAASAGKGTSAFFTVRVTNTGAATDSFTLEVPGLAFGIDASFDRAVLEVPPGAGSYRETTLALTPQPGAGSGGEPFSVRATGSDGETEGFADGQLTILAQGVDAAIDPPSGSPATTFSLTVTNLGAQADVFDLALAGPLATAAELAAPSVALAAGASQAVAIALDPLDMTLPGSLQLIATATSQADAAVKDVASALVSVASSTGVEALFEPQAIELPAPGTASFLLGVHNSGNGEDSYSATIVATTGAVTAAMTGLSGEPTQAVASFALPGLATGAIPLAATLSAPGTGSVTVRIQSLSDASLFVDATAIVGTDGVPTPTPSPTATQTPPPTPTVGPTASPTPSGGPLDAFKCYVVRTKTGTPQLPLLPGVELEDEFERIVAEVVREKRLCNAVAIGGEQPLDPAAHLACYALRPSPGLELVVPEDAVIDNRFGEQTVRFLGSSNERSLCVAAEAHVVGTPADEASDLQSYRCRRVRGVPNASLRPMPEVTLGDAFESKRMRVRRVHSLCTPVARDGAAVVDPAAHLACYQIAQAPGQPAFKPPGTIELSTDVGAQTVTVRNAQRTLCVPTRRK